MSQRYAARTGLLSRWGRATDATGGKDQRVRLVTAGRFGAGPGLDVEHERVVFRLPEREEDEHRRPGG